MQNDLDEWQTIASEIYRVSLFLYPKNFRRRFGSEMHLVFRDALDERSQSGMRGVLTFLGRELLEAPGSILNQHLQTQFRRGQPYLTNMLAFTVGFILLGAIDELKCRQILLGTQANVMDVFSLLFTGGIGGLAIGSILYPARKIRFALCGAAGFLLANTVLRQIFTRFFPDAFMGPFVGMAFLIPFFYASLEGCVYGLFIGMGTGKWRGIFRLALLGGLGLCMGFFINRLSAALIQSYLLHSPLAGWAAMLIFLVVPYLLEGILLGIVFGRGSQRDVALSPEPVAP